MEANNNAPTIEQYRLTLPENARPAFQNLANPTGSVCNLDCKYCFSLSKEMLFPVSRFQTTEELLAIYIKQLLESHQTPEMTIAWRGGEPTLMGLDFFKRLVAYIDKFKRPDQQVGFTIQTNGTVLDDDWCALFKEHNFMVGLIVDGPRALHDTYRVNKDGSGTFDQVMRGLDLLKKHNVDFNLLCTLHAANQDYPLEVYRFFRDRLGAELIQFIPIVERASAELPRIADDEWTGRDGSERPFYTPNGNLVTDRSVKPEKFGQFLSTVFDEWVRRDVGQIFVQHFDSALANWVNATGAACLSNETCGGALTVEHNGDLHSYDHYVEPGYKLSNIEETHMIELITLPAQLKFGRDKRDTLPRYCRQCEVRFACHGGCPENRFIKTPDGEAGLNYLCTGYKNFFNHIDNPMKLMAGLLRQGRHAEGVMGLLVQKERDRFVISRNDPCLCGSGKKFKQCHGW